jgi:hypothetical protein
MGSFVNDLTPLGGGLQLIFYDQRGSGHSQAGDTTQATLERNIADLDELIGSPLQSAALVSIEAIDRSFLDRLDEGARLRRA